MTLIIQSPNDRPFAQVGEIGAHAAALFSSSETPPDQEYVTFDVVYPDRETGEIGKGGSDRTTVSRLGVVVEAVSNA